MLTERSSLNQKWLILALFSSFFWGLAAHSYGFLNSNFSHDSLAEFYGEIYGNHFKFMTGRFLSPVYRAAFRTSITLPWMIGCLSLIWTGLSVFLTAKLFHIESKTIVFLLAGIYSTNLTVSCTAATFLHDLDCDMLSLLFSVAAVYVWNRKSWGWLPGAVLVAMSLALYQSYITVSITLVMMVCILDVLNVKSFQSVFFNGLKAIGMLLLGGILYFISMKAALRFVGMEMMTGAYNTLDKPLGMTPELLKYLIPETYYKFFKRILTVLSPYPQEVVITIGCILLFIAAAALIVGLLNNKIPLLQRFCCIVLIILLPFAMNLMHILMLGNTHELMRFAYWLFYLFVLLLAVWLTNRLKSIKFFSNWNALPAKLPTYIAIILVLVMVHSNVQIANIFHLKKDLEQEGYLSLMTRVIDKMEDYEAYVPGVTPVVMVGTPDQFLPVIPGFEEYSFPIGMQEGDVLNITARDRCEAYFKYILSNPVLFADTQYWTQLQADPQVAQMPSFPDDECIAMIDGIMVIKLGSKQ